MFISYVLCRTSASPEIQVVVFMLTQLCLKFSANPYGERKHQIGRMHPC
jgi:hypothetical protein